MSNLLNLMYDYDDDKFERVDVKIRKRTDPEKSRENRRGEIEKSNRKIRRLRNDDF